MCEALFGSMSITFDVLHVHVRTLVLDIRTVKTFVQVYFMFSLQCTSI